MGITVSRPQVIQRLRDAGWGFKRKGKHDEIYKLRGSPQRLNVPTRKMLPEVHVRVILQQAGLTPDQIEKFFGDCLSN